MQCEALASPLDLGNTPVIGRNGGERRASGKLTPATGRFFVGRTDNRRRNSANPSAPTSGSYILHAGYHTILFTSPRYPPKTPLKNPTLLTRISIDRSFLA